MAGHTYSHHLADDGQVATLVVDRDDGAHLLASDPEVVAWREAGNTLLPAPARPREATSYDLVSVLTDDEVAALGKAKAKDQHLFGKRDSAWPEDNPKIARFAAALGSSPKAWFDRVFAPAS